MAIGDLSLVQTLTQTPGTAGPWVRGVACDPEWSIMFNLTTYLTLASYRYDTAGNLSILTAIGTVGTTGGGLGIDTTNKLLFAAVGTFVLMYKYDIDGVFTFKASVGGSNHIGVAINPVDRICIACHYNTGIYSYNYTADGSSFVYAGSTHDPGGEAYGAGWDVGRRFFFVGSTIVGVDAYSCTAAGVMTHINNIDPGNVYGPQSVAVDANWKLVFIPIRNSGMGVFTYNETTGVISLVGTTLIGGRWYSVAIDTINHILFGGGSYTYSFTYNNLGQISANIDNVVVPNSMYSYSLAIDTTRHLLFNVTSPTGTISPARSAVTRSILYEAPAAFTSPTIFLAQRTNAHVVKALDSSTKLYNKHFGIFETPQTGSIGLNFPCSMATDASKNIYVCDSINRRIVQFTSSLMYSTSIEVFNEIGIPYALFFEPVSGDLYVAGIKSILYKTREYRISIARIPTSLSSITKYTDNIYDTHEEIGKPKSISTDFNAGFFIISGTDNLLKFEETGGGFENATVLPISVAEDSKYRGHVRHSNGDLYMNRKTGDGSFLLRVNSSYEGIGNSDKISKLSSFVYESYTGDIFVYDEANFVVKKYDEDLNFIEDIYQDTGDTVETDGKNVYGIAELFF